MSGRRRIFLRAAAIAVCTALLLAAARALDFGRTVGELRAAHGAWLVAAAASFFAILPLWSEQWRLLAPAGSNARRREMFAVVAMAAAAHNTMWAMAGETATVVLLVARVRLERAAAIAVLLLDQLLVGLAKIVLFAAAALALASIFGANGNASRLHQIDASAFARGTVALAAGVLALLTILLALAHRRGPSGLASARWIPESARPHVAAVADALAPLRDRRALVTFALALLKKGCELVAIVCVQRAFGIELPFASAVLVLAALNLATIVPIVPGNAGVYEAAVVWTYVRLGVPLERATGMAVAQHACYLAALALPGYRWLAGADPLRSAAAAA